MVSLRRTGRAAKASWLMFPSCTETVSSWRMFSPSKARGPRLPAEIWSLVRFSNPWKVPCGTCSSLRVRVLRVVIRYSSSFVAAEQREMRNWSRISFWRRGGRRHILARADIWSGLGVLAGSDVGVGSGAAVDWDVPVVGFGEVVDFGSVGAGSSSGDPDRMASAVCVCSSCSCACRASFVCAGVRFESLVGGGSPPRQAVARRHSAMNAGIYICFSCAGLGSVCFGGVLRGRCPQGLFGKDTSTVASGGLQGVILGEAAP